VAQGVGCVLGTHADGRPSARVAQGAGAMPTGQLSFAACLWIHS